MQFGGYFWGHYIYRWTLHIMFVLYINFRWNPGKVNFSAIWWPFWKSQPNWKFRKHPVWNLFLCQIWLRTLRQCYGYKVSNYCSIFRNCDLDLSPTNLKFMRLVPLSMSVLSFLYMRYCAETKKVSNFCSIFRSCDLDLWPTNLNINRLPSLTIRRLCTKIHLDPTFRS